MCNVTDKKTTKRAYYFDIINIYQIRLRSAYLANIHQEILFKFVANHT